MQMRNNTWFLAINTLFLTTITTTTALAQPRAAADRPSDETDSHALAPDPYRDRVAIMSGVGQWALFGGGNVAAQAKLGRWLVLEYSHGQALDLSRLDGFALTQAEKDAGVTVTMPWTTGGGVGLQITPELHVLMEVKAHHYEVRGADRNERLSYTTWTVGPGVFYDLKLWRGLFIQPNVRWWPTVASSLNQNQELTAADGGTYRHRTHDLNLFANLNVGWEFSQL